MKNASSPLVLAFAICLGTCAQQVAAQSVLLFGPVNVRRSPTTATTANPLTFNSNTLNLTCSDSPSATLSSNQDGTGNVLVDNNIFVTNLSVPSPAATDVCVGAVGGVGAGGGVPASCFTSNYGGSAAADAGLDPDTFRSTGGVPPINISNLLIPGSQQIKIDVEDEGVWLTSSTLYLNTNCSTSTVSGPGLISGNPITDDSSTQKQAFTFNPTTETVVTFQYDLTGAAGTLIPSPNVSIPQVGDSYIDPTTWQPTWAKLTSFATSSCLIHTGESLPNGGQACKLYTLECTTAGTSGTASGAQCPVSSESNEVFKDVFDGPAFTLPDIPTTGGPTFHEGIGFLMASEGWGGSTCTFDPASNLQDIPCPQNLLTGFSGPGIFTGTGTSSHPNSTFIMISGIPEDLTTVTVAGMTSGNWIKTSTASVSFSSQPPNLTNSSLPHKMNFVAAPIQSITYGISAPDSVPDPTVPNPSDTVLSNPNTACTVPLGAAATFNSPLQTLPGLADGSYLMHYYAQDCAGTRELLFTQDGSGSWSTHFYTFAINVDTFAPAITGPTFSAPGPYYQGQPVMATYRCMDGGSGVATCGSQSPGGAADSGSITVPVDTSGGVSTFTVKASDVAGNTSSQSAPYQVAIDAQIHFTVSPGTVTFPNGTNAQVVVANINGYVPTGTVQIMERGTLLATGTLKSGSATFNLKGLAVGTHFLSAVYLGDANNPKGTSAQAQLIVLPSPVTLSVGCLTTPLPFGLDFYCAVYASSNTIPTPGSITYKVDGGSPITVPLTFGIAVFTVHKPALGGHSVVVSYPAQTNYAAATPVTKNFTVVVAPVSVHLTPSTTHLTGGTLTLTASVQSLTAGPPNATGSVTFKDGSTTLATVPVNASGVATKSIAATSLTNGTHTFTASYSGGTNYGTGSGSATVQVAH